MARFENAILKVLSHEGGYSNNSNDPGGPTNFGVSLRFLRSTGDLKLWDTNHSGDIDIDDIKNITPQQASDIYKKYFWDQYPFEEIQDQELADKVFDLVVNAGPRPVFTVLQKTVNLMLPYSESKLVVDGIMGHKTVEKINSIVNIDLLFYNFIESMTEWYFQLVQNKPQLKSFLQGWLHRVRS